MSARRVRGAALVLTLALAAPACTSTTNAATNTPANTGASTANDTSGDAAGGNTAANDDTSTALTTTTLAETTTTPAETSTTLPETTTTPESTTTTEPPLDVYDVACVVEVRRGQSLAEIASAIPDEIVLPETIRDENGLADDVIHPDQLLDVCVGNGIDDITGEQRQSENEAVVSIQRHAVVVAQQEKLNELFAPYAISPLLVDGVSGPVTRQRLCAFRLSYGLTVSTENMAGGSDEEIALMEATELKLPFTTSLLSPRWALIDRTCQIMFVGEGADRLVFVFPTSTGEPGYETRNQDRSRAFRFNPAVDNGGWHNSSTYPVAEDNPLNGNMYKPIYFDNGQAIHGALNVPTAPRSKGCARLRVEHMNLLVQWLGLDTITYGVGAKQINLTVNVQGTYVAR
ncbi:MAG TPA: L,D-transpeptidase [Ilumatobacteraceae bacterium]|nr:L,D-transpeptidase [Ilumatobacteraceae bacterium]